MADPCCPVASRLSPESLEALGEALRALHAGTPGAASLNALSKLYGFGKVALAKHRDACLGLSAGSGTGSRPLHKVHPKTAPEPVPVPPVEVVGKTRKPLSIPTSSPAQEEVVLEPVPEPPSEPAEVAVLPTEAQDSSGRTLALVPADADTAFARRSLVVADLMARGKWNRQEAKRLAATWGVTLTTVYGYGQAAGVALAADRGHLEQQRQVSLAYCEARRQAYRQDAKRLRAVADQAKEVAESTEDDMARARALGVEATARKQAVEAGKLELAWHEHADKVSGVMVQASTQVNVNVLALASSPHFEAFMGVILGALDEHLEAREKVISVVSQEIESRRGKRAA